MIYHEQTEAEAEQSIGYVVPDQFTDLCANVRPLGYSPDYSLDITFSLSQEEHQQLVNCVWYAAPILYPEIAAQVLWNMLSGTLCE